MAHVPNEYKLPRMARRAVQERLKGSYILTIHQVLTLHFK